MAFVPTGKNSYQNGLAQILFTRVGTLFSFTEEFLPFAAYDPQRLPQGTQSFFLTFKDGKYTIFNIGKTSYQLNDLAIIKFGDKLAIKIQKALAFIRLSDGSLVIFTNGKFVAHLIDKELIKIFFNPSEEKTVGAYYTKNGSLYLGNNKVANQTLGVGIKGYDALACATKNILSRNEVNKLKTLTATAQKKFLAELISKKEERDYYLQSIWWMAPLIGLDLSNFVLVKLNTEGSACIFTETPLNPKS